MRSSRKLWSDNAKRWKTPHASVRTSVSSSDSPSAVLVLCQLQKEQHPRLFQGKYTVIGTRWCDAPGDTDESFDEGHDAMLHANYLDA
jgi:hypothetical protein